MLVNISCEGRNASLDQGPCKILLSRAEVPEGLAPAQLALHRESLANPAVGNVNCTPSFAKQKSTPGSNGKNTSGLFLGDLLLTELIRSDGPLELDELLLNLPPLEASLTTIAAVVAGVRLLIAAGVRVEVSGHLDCAVLEPAGECPRRVLHALDKNTVGLPQ